MDDLEYRQTKMVIKTATGVEEYKDFIENGVNKAKSAIIKALTEKPAGLSYLELDMLVAELFSKEARAAAWKVDSFIVALAGLELEDKKIKRELGVYKLVNRQFEGG